MILASFGLGSSTLSVWLVGYSWVFSVATFALLGFAYYKTYRNKNSGAWSKWTLHLATALSLGLIVYKLLYR